MGSIEVLVVGPVLAGEIVLIWPITLRIKRRLLACRITFEARWRSKCVRHYFSDERLSARFTGPGRNKSLLLHAVDTSGMHQKGSTTTGKVNS